MKKKNKVFSTVYYVYYINYIFIFKFSYFYFMHLHSLTSKITCPSNESGRKIEKKTTSPQKQQLKAVQTYGIENA